MIADLHQKKHDEFNVTVRPILEGWYKKRIESSGKNPSSNNVFHQDVNAYLNHVHGVYDCVKKGMNPLDVWKTLPNVEYDVVKHFESKVHKIESKITNIQTSIQRQTPIVVIHSTHTIGEWIFDCDVHISKEVDVWCSSMKHNTDESSKLNKLDFNQVKKSFEQNDLLDVLARA